MGVEPGGHGVLERAALRAHPGDEQGKVLRQAADRGDRRRCGRPGDESDGASGIPAERELGDALVQRTPALAGGMFEDIGGTGVAGPRDQQHPAAHVGEKRFDGVVAHQGIDRCRVGAEMGEHRARVRLGRAADVAALAVDDEQAIVGDT